MKFVSRMYGTIIVIMVCVFVLMGAIVNQDIVNSFFYNNEDIALSQAEILSKQINSLLESKQNLVILLGSFALTDYITALDKNKDPNFIEEKRQDAAMRFMVFAKQFDVFPVIRFVDTKGDVLIKILDEKIVDNPNENLAQEKYFKSLLSSSKDKKYIYMNSAFKPGEEPVVNIACLVDYQNKDMGIIVVTYNLSDIQDMFKDIKFKKVWFAEDSFAWMLTGINVKPELIACPEKYKYDLSFIGTLDDDIIFATKSGILDGKEGCKKYSRLWYSLNDSILGRLKSDRIIDENSFKLLQGELKNSKFSKEKLVVTLKKAGISDDNKINTILSYASSGEELRVVAFTPVSEALNWSVAISIPYSTFFSSLESLQTRLILAIVISMLLFIILIFAVVVNFGKTFTRFANNVQSMVDCSETSSSLFIEGNDEIADIGTSINELHKRYQVLLKKVHLDINSLTGLPGNLTVQRKLFDLIDSKEKFAAVRVDITNFNIYNKRYGFDRGDSVLRLLSTMIVNTVKEYGNKTDFVSHLGGDDFVFITTPDKAEKISLEIISFFDRIKPYFYNEEDREKKEFTWKDKEGVLRKYTFMNLAIGVSTNEKRIIIHPIQITKIFFELIGYIKKQDKGSMCFKDRRTRDREPFIS